MPRKIAFIQGSPRKNGNTRAVAAIAMEAARENNAEVVEIDATELEFKTPGCIGCRKCQQSEEFVCAIGDQVAQTVATLPEYDVIVTLQRNLLTIYLDIYNKVCHTTRKSLKKGGRLCYRLPDVTNTFTRYQSLISAKAILKTLLTNSVDSMNNSLIAFSAVNPEITFLTTWQGSSAR